MNVNHYGITSNVTCIILRLAPPGTECAVTFIIFLEIWVLT